MINVHESYVIYLSNNIDKNQKYFYVYHTEYIFMEEKLAWSSLEWQWKIELEIFKFVNPELVFSNLELETIRNNFFLKKGHDWHGLAMWLHL